MGQGNRAPSWGCVGVTGGPGLCQNGKDYVVVPTLGVAEAAKGIQWEGIWPSLPQL